MDSELEPATIQKTVSNQGILLGQHEHIIWALSDSHLLMVKLVTHLTKQVGLLTSQITPAAQHIQPAPESPSPRESYASDPEPLTGDLNKCRGLLLQCSLVFSQHSEFPLRSIQDMLYGFIEWEGFGWGTSNKCLSICPSHTK